MNGMSSVGNPGCWRLKVLLTSEMLSLAMVQEFNVVVEEQNWDSLIRNLIMERSP
jgi:hypothetical protein